jgi:hypothetical protein
MSRAAIDERGFELARQIREANGELSVQEFKALIREQFSILVLDQDAALGAIPIMLPADAESRRKAFDLIKKVLAARGEMSEEDSDRLGEVARLFGVDDDSAAARLPRRQSREEFQARAS